MLSKREYSRLEKNIFTIFHLITTESPPDSNQELLPPQRANRVFHKNNIKPFV